MDITFNDLNKIYGFNSHRKKILESLDNFLSSFHEFFHNIPINIFGGFITSKEFPNDIDIYINKNDLYESNRKALDKILNKSPRYLDVNFITFTSCCKEALKTSFYYKDKSDISFNYREKDFLTKIYIDRYYKLLK